MTHSVAKLDTGDCIASQWSGRRKPGHSQNHPDNLSKNHYHVSEAKIHSLILEPYTCLVVVLSHHLCLGALARLPCEEPVEPDLKDCHSHCK